MIIIWKSLIEYVNNNLQASKSVNIKGFGAFTFDIDTELPRIASRSINPTCDLFDTRLERKHVHKVRPCFVVDPSL